MRSSLTCSRSERRAGLGARLMGRLAGLACAGLVCGGGIALLPQPAAAQMGNPGFMMPDTGTDEAGLPRGDRTNAADILFVQLVGEGGLAEVSFGELARDKAASDAVKAFGARMVEEHGAANDKLAGIAREAGVAVPDALNAEHAAMRDDLEGMESAAFDLAYMRGQVVDHQKTATLLAWEITSGQYAALQRFAADTLPAVLDHLAVARGLVEDLARAQVADARPEARP